MITIATFATKSYCQILPHVCRRISAAALHHKEVLFVLAGDSDKATCDAFKKGCDMLPKEWEKIHLKVTQEAEQGDNKYNKAATVSIAVMQGAAFDLARQRNSDLFWSVESDILVPADALTTSEWVLQMPNNYYDIAFVTYANGSFLGGRGEPRSPIYEDCSIEERQLPEELQSRFDEIQKEGKELEEKKELPSKEWSEKRDKIFEEIRKCPPKGNVWELNAKYGWKKRGWLDWAYPAIGRGCVVPTDWVGMGCTLLSKRALACASFEGYDGSGTQDLYLSYHRWHSNNLRMAVITHTLCDHVKPNDKGEMTHYRAFHEQYGDSQGHLRMQAQPWTPV